MTDELRRLEHGPSDGEVAAGFLVHMTAVARDPEDTLTRIREALNIAMGSNGSYEASEMLPDWFIAASAPEMTADEADAALAPWRKDPIKHQDDPWPASNWLYWFEPELRSWWWWDAQRIGEHGLDIVLVVEGFPFASEALRWLLTAAGAREVSVDA